MVATCIGDARITWGLVSEAIRTLKISTYNSYQVLLWSIVNANINLKMGQKCSFLYKLPRKTLMIWKTVSDLIDVLLKWNFLQKS